MFFGLGYMIGKSRRYPILIAVYSNPYSYDHKWTLNILSKKNYKNYNFFPAYVK